MKCLGPQSSPREPKSSPIGPQRAPDQPQSSPRAPQRAPEHSATESPNPGALRRSSGHGKLSTTRLTLSGLVVSFWGSSLLAFGLLHGLGSFAPSRGSGPFSSQFSSPVVCCSRALFLSWICFVPFAVLLFRLLRFVVLASLFLWFVRSVVVVPCLLCYCPPPPRVAFFCWGYRWLASSSHWPAAAPS